jgi:hypothetical protein
MATRQTLFIERTNMLNGINRFGKALKSVGLDPFRLEAGAIIQKAAKKADFKGSLPLAEDGLHRMVEAVNRESKPNTFGAMAVKGLLERSLYGRYKVEQHLTACPEIEKSPIHQPLFIIGMPRTGTTILHALLHEDPAHRSPLAWECLLPYPPATPENFRDNEHLYTIRREFNQLFKLVPDFLRKHYMAADSPQECLGIDALDFNTFQISAQLYVPSYMEWVFDGADRLSTMRFHKRFLQFLQSGGVKGDRWLLKSPVHLMRLPELFEVYPDARIIMTHREPTNVVTSTASLISSVRSLYSDFEDPFRTGKEQLETWSRYFKRFLEARKILRREDQIIDLKFDDFATDHIGTVKKIYDCFGWELTDIAVDRFRGFLQKNPKGKNGVHYYTPEDFGLTRDIINAEFKEYNEFLTTLQ